MGLGTAAPLNVGTGANNIVQLNASSQLPAVSGALLTNLPSGVVRNFLSGLTLSTAGSSTTFSVAAGVAASLDNSLMMTLAAAISKTTAAWAVGSAAGSLDTGTIAANTWYHAWLIERTDTGVVDVLTSLSATAPTMPTNYTKKRYIGSLKTDASSNWLFFIQYDDLFLWGTPIADVAAGTAGTVAGALITVSTPPGFKCALNYIVRTDWVSAGNFILCTSPDQANAAPGASLYTDTVLSTQTPHFQTTSTMTNTSSQIRVRVDNAGIGFGIMTTGYTNTRGRF
jgi:hypothetical protein